MKSEVFSLINTCDCFLGNSQFTIEGTQTASNGTTNVFCISCRTLTSWYSCHFGLKQPRPSMCLRRLHSGSSSSPTSTPLNARWQKCYLWLAQYYFRASMKSWHRDLHYTAFSMLHSMLQCLLVFTAPLPLPLLNSLNKVTLTWLKFFRNFRWKSKRETFANFG